MKKWILGLWLDDERKPDKWFLSRVENYYVAKSYEDATFFLASLTPADPDYNEIFIDFDHDLGKLKTGYDFAKYLLEHNIKIKAFTTHTMNPVRAKNIHQLLTHYNYNYIPRYK